MSPAQRELQRADNAERSQKSKALKALKKSERYQAMNSAERKAAEETTLAEIKEKRYILIIFVIAVANLN